jgi:hypothetical protein
MCSSKRGDEEREREIKGKKGIAGDSADTLQTTNCCRWSAYISMCTVIATTRDGYIMLEYIWNLELARTRRLERSRLFV